MEIKEMLGKSEKELRDFIREQKAILRSLCVKAAQKQIKGIRDIRKTKKTIARAFTRISELQKPS